MADPLLQEVVGRQADGVADALGLERLVQLGLGEGRIATKVEIKAVLTVTGDHRLEHGAPVFRAVHVPGRRRQRSRSPNWLNTNSGW